MRRFNKVKIFTICMAISAATLTGCGKSEKSQKESENNNVSSSVVKEAEYINCFDVSSLAASIKINEQEMEFPIDMTKLKESITFDDLGQLENPNFYSGVLLDENVGIGSVQIYSASSDLKTDGFIYSFEISEGSPWYVSIGNITFGASIEDVKNAIGAPLFENGTLDDTYRVYYENCEYEYIAFTFKQGVLKTISFKYMPAEWRSE